MHRELLQEDLIQGMMSRPTRTEAKVLASRIVDLIAEMAEDIATDILTEHCRTFDHDFKKEEY